MKITCEKCDKEMNIGEDKVGKKIKCKGCSHVFTIQSPDDTDSKMKESDVAVTDFIAPDTIEWTQDEIDKIEHLRDAIKRIDEQVRKAVVGQEDVVKLLMISLFAQGHSLLMGVPGLGKTLLVRTIASSLSLNFKRVQFTPDLMPSDITGTEVIEENKSTGDRQFRFLEGPIFTNILLADEINRTPPKTQASLLEAMEEKQVTVGGERRPLDPPFFVLATQNPIEQEGTYSLPEAQLDRFMFLIRVSYPQEEEERLILSMTTSGYKPDIKPVLDKKEILELQKLVRKVNVPYDVVTFVIKLVRNSRCSEKDAPDFVKQYVSWGAGPRACQNLVFSAKAIAAMDGRHKVKLEDVKQVAHSVMGHRISVNFSAEAEGIDTHKIIDMLLDHIG